MVSSSIHNAKLCWVGVAAALLLSFPAAFAVPSSNGDSGAYLGVHIADLDQAEAAALKLRSTSGVVVQSIDHDGPACKAGMQTNDVIVSVNGASVNNAQEMVQIMQGLAAGSVANVGIVRDGKSQSMKVTLGSRKSWVTPHAAPMPNNYDTRSSVGSLPPVPFSTDVDVPLMMPASARRGIVVESLTTQLAEFFGVPGGQGVLVRNVQRGSLGATAGFKAGDVIVKNGAEPVRDLADWRRSMSISSGKTSFHIIRDKREQLVEMVLPGPAGELRLGEDWDQFGRDMDALNQQLEKLAPEIQSQTAQAALFRPDDLQKMQHEIEESVRKNVNPQIRIEAAAIQKQVEQMRPEIESQMRSAQEQIRRLGPELQQQMQQMQRSMTVLNQQDLAKMREQINQSLQNIGPEVQEQMKQLAPQLQQQMQELQKQMQQHQKEWQDMMKSWPNSTDRPNQM